ncbi:hypothetical protein ACFL1N_14125 [Thermodesulfobacteriota bacterium]
MFGIGIGELLIIFIVLLAIVTGIILLLRALLKSQGPSQNQSERLKELQKMKSEGLIVKMNLVKNAMKLSAVFKS